MDQPCSDTFLALRRWPQAALPTVGRYTAAWYLADNGFEGAATTLHWKRDYAATVLAAPAHKQEDRWPRRWWLWFKSLRQIVETVYDKLENWFGLGRDRNHELSGFHVRFAAKVTLHNFLIYLNRQLGRPPWRSRICSIGNSHQTFEKAIPSSGAGAEHQADREPCLLAGSYCSG